MGLETPLWRAIAVFRIAAVGYAVLLVLGNRGSYTHPLAGMLVLGVMAGWTAVTAWAYAVPVLRRWPLLLADLGVTAGCLYASRWVIPHADLANGAATLPMAWEAGAVLAWAVCGGRRRGAVAALAIGLVDLAIRGQVNAVTVNSTVLLLLAGVITAYIAHLTAQAEQKLQRAAELDAATRERERLARGIHDSVLQVLALLQRRGAELGGDAAEMGRLAGEQEATLRTLIGTAGSRGAGTAGARPGGPVDLRALLDGCATGTVSVAAPATAVALPEPVAVEVAAAVRGALDNVTVHCGLEAKAWVLLEDEGDTVTVTVRDEGPGIPDGRLAQAEAEGRLGVAQSIRGRVRDLGGSVQISSTPGQGTEVELRIPRLS